MNIPYLKQTKKKQEIINRVFDIENLVVVFDTICVNIILFERLSKGDFI